MGCSRSACVGSEEDGQLPGSASLWGETRHCWPSRGSGRAGASLEAWRAGARLTLHEGVGAGLTVLATPPRWLCGLLEPPCSWCLVFPVILSRNYHVYPVTSGLSVSITDFSFSFFFFPNIGFSFFLILTFLFSLGKSFHISMLPRSSLSLR